MPLKKRQSQIRRIMEQSVAMFNHQVTAQHYIDLYETMLQRPLVNPMPLPGQVIPIRRDKKELYGQTTEDDYDEKGFPEAVWENQQASQAKG
jgi:hypothetical protein